MHWYQICFGFLLFWMLIFISKIVFTFFRRFSRNVLVKECGRNNVIFWEASLFSFPTVKENEIKLLKKRRSIWIHLENHVYSLKNVKYESFTWGRYPQRCTARWLVRSAFVKQKGYALCTPKKMSTFLRTILSVKRLQDKYVRVFYGHVCILILLGFCL